MITIMEKNVGSGQGTLRKLYGEAPKKLGLATVEVTWLPIIIPLATWWEHSNKMSYNHDWATYFLIEL